jgi:two-component system alkaline phosphatase synthesis response regulator PhoP
MQNTEVNILLVDDEPDVLEFLSYNLGKEGFKVYCCSNGLDAIDTAHKINPNLIVLDVMMPYMDGFETCREIRKDSQLRNTIIAFLSAKGEDFSQVEGFESGADDFIRKPVRPKVFISRVRALLRRQPGKAIIQNRVIFDDLIIDKECHSVITKGISVELSKKEFELLLLLASRPGKVFSRDEIFSGVWGSDVIVGERTIDVHIRKIREKVGFDNIKTVKGVGYFFA